MTPTGELDREQMLTVLRSEREQARAELDRRLDLEKALADVSREFTAAVHPDFDRALACLGRAVAVHRVRVFRFRENQARVDNVLEWCADGLESQQALMQDLESAHFHWWLARIRRGEDIVIPDVSALPPEAAAERQMLEAQGALAVLAVPLLDTRGGLDGFIGFLDVERPRIWSNDDARILHVAGEMFAVAYAREAAAGELMTRGRELQAALEAKTEFLSIVSHELRAPLMVVLGRAELLLERAQQAGPQEEEYAAGLESIRRQALRLRRLIDDLLNEAYRDRGGAARQRDAEPDPRAAAPGAGPASRKPRLVVVDDDRDALAVLRMMLADRFEVSCFSSPGVALAHLEGHEADLVLLDWMMPGMDGLSVLDQLQRDPRTSEVPVVFISGKADAWSVRQALERGARAFVTKPFTRDELLEVVGRYLRKGAAGAVPAE